MLPEPESRSVATPTTRNPCKSCGGNDHAHLSSTKCPNHKPKIAKRTLDSTKTYSVYNIKHGLERFFCPLLDTTIRDKLRARIREHARVVSRLIIETSLLVNAYYSYYYEHQQQFPSATTRQVNFQHFTYVLKEGSETWRRKIHDPLGFVPRYMAERTQVMKSPALYDGKLRNFLLGEASKQYETIFKTNITSHMFQRVKKFITLSQEWTKKQEQKHRQDRAEKGEQVTTPTTCYDKREIHRLCYEYYYGSKPSSLSSSASAHHPITQFLQQQRLTAAQVEKCPAAYVPFLYSLQRLQNLMEVRAICVFPEYRQRVHHITYTSVGLYELLKAVLPPKTLPSTYTPFLDDARTWWKRYFHVAHLPLFACQFSTNGYVVSKLMSREVKKEPLKRTKQNNITDDDDVSSPTKKRQKVDHAMRRQQSAALSVMDGTNFDNVIAVDPGAKIPLFTCDLHERYMKFSQKRVAFEAHDHIRKRKLARWTGAVERKIQRIDLRTLLSAATAADVDKAQISILPKDYRV